MEPTERTKRSNASALRRFVEASSATRGVSQGSHPERKVLVLGHDTRAFLSVVRSLGRAGIDVHVAWFKEGMPALRSRYVAKAHRIPAYRPDTTAWKDRLAALMRTERFDLVIPCDARRALPLAAHRAELERWGRVAPSPARSACRCRARRSSQSGAS